MKRNRFRLGLLIFFSAVAVVFIAATIWSRFYRLSGKENESLEIDISEPSVSESIEVPESLPVELVSLKPSPDLRFVLPVMHELKMPEKLAVYKPEIVYAPTVSYAWPQTDLLMGEIQFINKDKEFLELPENVSNYFPIIMWGGIYDWVPDKLTLPFAVAYALENEDKKIAIMRTDGEIVTDFIYSPYKELDVSNSLQFETLGGYMVVKKDGSFGVLDIRSGKEVVPCEYVDIWLNDYGVFAYKYGENSTKQEDCTEYLLDYNGNILYSAENSETVGICEKMDECWGIGSSFPVVFVDKDLIVLPDYPDSTEVSFYGGVFTIVSNKYTESMDVLVYTMDGALLYEKNDILECYFFNGAVNIRHASHIDVIYKDSINKIKQDELYYKYLYVQDNAFQGNVEIGRGEGELGERLLSDQGEVLIPFGVYSALVDAGDFVLCYENRKNTIANKLVAIANREGEILLENPLGALTETMLDGVVLVYKDANTGGFLYPDGRFEEIDLPKVTKKFIKNGNYFDEYLGVWPR